MGKTRLRGACGGVGYMCVRSFSGFVCLCFVHASSETLQSGTKAQFRAVLSPEAAHLAATADPMSE